MIAVQPVALDLPQEFRISISERVNRNGNSLGIWLSPRKPEGQASRPSRPHYALLDSLGELSRPELGIVQAVISLGVACCITSVFQDGAEADAAVLSFFARLNETRRRQAQASERGDE